MFGMEDIVSLRKTASDHIHPDSKGKPTFPSKHEEGKEENPHTHDLKDGGETDKKPSGEDHKHKEIRKDGEEGETGLAIKTAFKKGFEKEAVILTSVSKALTAGPRKAKVVHSIKNSPLRRVAEDVLGQTITDNARSAAKKRSDEQSIFT